MPSFTPTVLSIAGSDPYGGAGIQVDAKTIHALGAYAFTVPTALTAQNSTGVKAVEPVSTAMFRQQLESILEDVEVDAVKIGMLANAEIIMIIAEMIDRYKLKNIILDTVLVSSSGKPLLEKSAVKTMAKELFPRVDLITPNLLEVETLVGKQMSVEVMAKALFDLGANTVLIKGGHSVDENATDYFAQKPLDISSFSSPRISTTHNHGTGCLLSSAIATYLASGKTMLQSVQLAKEFLTTSMQKADTIQFRYRDNSSNRSEPLL